jgi:hypothetical protein
MPDGGSELVGFLRNIATGEPARVLQLLAADPSLATARVERAGSRRGTTDFYLDEISHYVYGGDSALHVAAAGYRLTVAQALLAAGADIGARNRRGAQPLHYAADGVPGGPHWNPPAQAETIALLIAAGADPNACDNSGVTPLHRAVRTRCAAAVKALLDGGADPELPNRNGSTPVQLAIRSTGRGGSGSAEALAEQARIAALLGIPGSSPRHAHD